MTFDDLELRLALLALTTLLAICVGRLLVSRAVLARWLVIYRKRSERRLEALADERARAVEIAAKMTSLESEVLALRQVLTCAALPAGLRERLRPKEEASCPPT